MFDERAEPQVRRVFEKALSGLIHSGAIITEHPLPDGFSNVLHHHRVIMASEAASEHRALFAAHSREFLPKIRELIEEGLATPVSKYLESRKHRSRLIDEMVSSLNDVDAW